MDEVTQGEESGKRRWSSLSPGDREIKGIEEGREANQRPGRSGQDGGKKTHQGEEILWREFHEGVVATERLIEASA